MPPVIMFILIVLLLSIASQLWKIRKDILTFEMTFEWIRHSRSQSDFDLSNYQDDRWADQQAEDGLSFDAANPNEVNWKVIWLGRLMAVIAFLTVCLIIKLVFSIS